ncbi:zinc finger protein, putative [Plasmodium gallinaceum]|uniref:Zinc finger protein, putative n=1 Tax=Plasmodium gallinaceum TaxID=5849 RepID=A0A1J1GL22_PLAGA|nr:zinc finger protein, putative [Plasmodium gallinaceum]CRG93019.1 zinc finger protein, putative [Plasmodium gallinaceum]
MNTQSSLVIAQIPRKKQFYKTKMCPWFFSGRCDRGVDCLFAHSQDELNPIPDLSFTSLCPLAKKSGLCKNEKCSYAHSVCELRPTGDLYKTAPCTKFLRGKCNAEAHCRHAHYIEELRPLPGNVSPSQNAINLMLSSSISNPLQKINKKNSFLNDEKKNEKILKQSNSLIGNFPSQNNKFTKKFVKNASADNGSININNNINNKNYQKSSSFPNKMYPLLKNKDNNGESKLHNNINFKNYLINSDLENNNVINNFNINKLQNMCNQKKEIGRSYKSLNELRGQDSNINNNINTNKFYNLSKAKNIDTVNHYSSFSTKEPSTPMRMSSTSSKDLTSNNDENNLVDTIEHMEITAQDSALKVIEDDSEKMNSSDIKNFLNLLQMKNSNNFSKDNFLFNDNSTNNSNALYSSYKPISSSKDKLEQQLNLESHFSDHYLNNNIQNIKNKEENMNNYDSNNNLKNIYKFNNNSLISCSNFWNYPEDELSTVAPKMAQKVEIFDY